MERTESDRMNPATFEALRQVGATEAQAVVLATAIPDIEPLRGEMDAEFTKLRGEMDTEFTKLRGEMELGFASLRGDIERRITAQTWTIVATLVAVGGLLVATNLWG